MGRSRYGVAMADDVDRGTERQKGEIVGLIVGALLAAALVAFILQNTNEVRVEWLAWEVDAPLWLAMVVTAAGALVLARIVGFVVRRRRRS
jgi:uncharacterized integral membrane protein